MSKADRARLPSADLPNAGPTRSEYDRCCWESIRSGEPGGFEELYVAYAPALARYLLRTRLVRSAADAEDIVHQVFLQIWTRRAAIEIARTVQSYLYRAVTNAAADVRSHDDVVERHGTRESLRLISACDPTPPAMESVEKKDSVEYALSLLTHDQRRVLVLRIVEGLSRMEAADVLGMHMRKIDRLLAEGLRVLRQSF